MFEVKIHLTKVNVEKEGEESKWLSDKVRGTKM